MGKHVFISRKLNEDSIFFDLKRDNHRITDVSLISIEYLDFEVDEQVDLVFFYSKNAVEAFFKIQSYQQNVQYGVMGQGTAEKFIQLTGQSAHFIGNGVATDIAKEINIKYKEKKVLFPQASQSLQSVEQLIDRSIESKSLVVYNNVIINVDLPQDFDLLVFTSPLNVKSFFEYQKYNGQTVVAIGHSTGNALKDLSLNDIILSPQANMKTLLETTRTAL